ncbi:tripartite tricarboxylate transporter substrate binding protein [Comamonas aquatica]|nr:tripartite tricarboxylate transporter substrate binding protein [Comamonas aquatica]
MFLFHTPTVSRRLTLASILAGVFALTATPGAVAQSYPSRPVKLIVPFAAGSATDTAARIIGAAISTSMGQPVVIDNKAGAGGTIGSNSVAASPADGYTLVMTSSSTHSAATALIKGVPYDGVESFVHIARVANIPLMLVTRPSLGVSSIKELVESSNKKELTYAYGSATSQIAAGTFNTEAKAKALGVPYRSQPPAVADVYAGQVDYMFGDISVVKAFVETKKLTPLAVSTPGRLPAFPTVPSLQELGFKNFDLVVWVGLAAPKGTPAAIVELLAKETRAALQSPEVVAKLSTAGMEVAPLTGDELRKFTIAQKAAWTARAEVAGVKPE